MQKRSDVRHLPTLAPRMIGVGDAALFVLFPVCTGGAASVCFSGLFKGVIHVSSVPAVLGLPDAVTPPPP